MDNENQFSEMDIDDIQKEVFAENLRYYIELNQKQQIDVAKDLGINPKLKQGENRGFKI